MKRQFGSIRKLPSGKYQARHRTPRGDMVAAPKPFRTKADASAYLAEVEADLRRGTWIDHRRSEITFAEWVREYRSVVRKRATTEARDAVVIRKHLMPALGHLRLSDITPMRIQQVVNDMADVLAPKTVATDYGVLRAILSSAVNDDRLTRTPCRGIRLPDLRQPARRVFTLAEIDRLASAIPVDYQLMVYLGGILGLRWSEVIALRVSSLKLLQRPPMVAISTAMPTADGRAVLGDTKSISSARVLPLGEHLTRLSAAHLAQRGLTAADEDELLFVAPRGGTVHAANFRLRIWQPAVELVGLAHATFADLRRSAMTLWGEAGLTPKAIQTLAGHSDPRLAQAIYQQVTNTLLSDTAARLDALWEEHDAAGEQSDVV